MQTNLFWTGREYYSLENCLVDVSDAGADIHSTIIGKYKEMIYKVEYRIKTNQNWETLLVEIDSRHSNQRQTIRLEGDGRGNWMVNGKTDIQFKGCIDVDIPLTPFTNTLPIRRLGLIQGQTAEISVIYCDLLEQEIRPVRQKYKCLSATMVQYENVPNDFEATIQVDESGFVVDYPFLFFRNAVVETNYSQNNSTSD